MIEIIKGYEAIFQPMLIGFGVVILGLVTLDIILGRMES